MKIIIGVIVICMASLDLFLLVLTEKRKKSTKLVVMQMLTSFTLSISWLISGIFLYKRPFDYIMAVVYALLFVARILTFLEIRNEKKSEYYYDGKVEIFDATIVSDKPEGIKQLNCVGFIALPDKSEDTNNN